MLRVSIVAAMRGALTLVSLIDSIRTRDWRAMVIPAITPLVLTAGLLVWSHGDALGLDALGPAGRSILAGLVAIALLAAWFLSRRRHRRRMMALDWPGKLDDRAMRHYVAAFARDKGFTIERLQIGRYADFRIARGKDKLYVKCYSRMFLQASAQDLAEFNRVYNAKRQPLLAITMTPAEDHIVQRLSNPTNANIEVVWYRELPRLLA